MAVVFCLSSASLADAAPTLALRAPAALVAPIQDGVRAERADVEFVNETAAPDVLAEISQLGDELRMTLSAQGGSTERPLGSNLESATRLAILLIVRALPPGVDTSSAAPGKDAIGGLRVEVGVNLHPWTEPTTPRVGLTLAGSTAFGRLRAGGRVLVTGLCCTVSGDALEVSGLEVMGLAEGRFAVWEGPLRVELMAALGVSWERLEARAVGVFAGMSAPERRTRVDLAFRAGLSASLPVSTSVVVSATVGALGHGSRRTVLLPAPFGDGRTPSSRGPVVPFAELSAGLELF